MASRDIWYADDFTFIGMDTLSQVLFSKNCFALSKNENKYGSVSGVRTRIFQCTSDMHKQELMTPLCSDRFDNSSRFLKQIGKDNEINRMKSIEWEPPA